MSPNTTRRLGRLSRTLLCVMHAGSSNSVPYAKTQIVPSKGDTRAGMRPGLALPFIVLALAIVACVSTSDGVQERQVPAPLTLSPLEREVLETCFRTAMKESELAAVLYGNKPMCWDGPGAFKETPNFSRVRRPFTNGELYLRGLAIWQHLDFTGTGWSFVPANTHCVDDPSSSACLWINHAALRDVLNEHLEVFRGILGAQVSSEELFARLTTPGVDLRATLNDDDFLIGLVLGYGKENSLLHKAYMDIRYLLLSQELVPLRPRNQRLPGAAETRIGIDPHTHMWIEVPPTKLESRLSSRFSTLCAEYKQLDAHITSSTQHPLAEGYHVPLFGCIAESPDTKARIANYAQAMKQGEELLTRDDFLDQVVSRLCS